MFKQDIPVSQSLFDEILAAHNKVGVNKPLDNVFYGFPKSEGWGCTTFNCATYPSSLGVPSSNLSGSLVKDIPTLKLLVNYWIGL